MGTFPVQRGRRCGGVRHTATAAGRAFGPSSLCYMTKDPLSPGFFPHRPGGYLKVPSQLFKGAQIPSSVRGDDETRRGGPPACLVLSPRNAAAPSPDPHNPQTRHSKGAQPTQGYPDPQQRPGAGRRPECCRPLPRSPQPPDQTLKRCPDPHTSLPRSPQSLPRCC